MEPSAQGQSSTPATPAQPAPDTSEVSQSPAPQESMQATPQPPTTTTPAPPQPITPQKPKSNLLLLMVGFVIVFLMGIGFEKYHVSSFVKRIPLPHIVLVMPTPTPKAKPSPTSTPTPTPNPMSNWKTYTNTKYGFSLKYPADYSTNDSITSEGDPAASFEPSTYKNKTALQLQSLPVVQFDVLTFLPTSTTLPDAYNQLKAPGFNNKQNMKIATMSGLETLQFNSTNTQAGSGKPDLYTMAKLKDGYIVIFGLTNYQADPLMVSAYNQILSTFTFAPFATPTTTPASSTSATPQAINYTCPQSGWVDCTPTAGGDKSAACSQDAMTWYKANCPNFKGGAM